VRARAARGKVRGGLFGRYGMGGGVRLGGGNGNSIYAG
jgi:hypothetical protein